MKNEHYAVYIYNNNINYKLQKYVFVNEEDIYSLNLYNLTLIQTDAFFYKKI